MNDTKPLGRPSKYNPEYCDKIIAFFDKEFCRTTKETFYYKNGDTKEKEIEVGNELPFFSAFERTEGLGIGRCSKWAKAKYPDDYANESLRGKYKYPDFRQAYKYAKGLQKEMLVANALRGLYQGAFSIFTAKNILGWRDQSHIDHTSQGDKIERPLIIPDIPSRNDETQTKEETAESN